MLRLLVGATESFNDETNEFVKVDGVVLELEHSLYSLSKWESKYKKPFITSDKTLEETIDYVRMMVVTPDFPPEIFQKFTQEDFDAVKEYIADPMTATWFSKEGKSKAAEIITAEVMYYWLVSMQIPFEVQYWHLNRMLTLVKVWNEKQKPQTKMSKADLAARNRQLNAERRAKLGTTG